MITAQASAAKPVNPKVLDGVGDNTQLMHLHEPSLLFNIRARYAKDLIYTYTGPAIDLFFVTRSNQQQLICACDTCLQDIS